MVNVVKGDWKRLGPEWIETMDKMRNGWGACMPREVKRYFKKNSESSVYDYNQFLWNTWPEMEKAFTAQMGDKKPKDFR